MKQIKKVGRRGLAMILAILMLLSCGQNGLIGMVSAVTENSVTITAGALLAKSYSLSAAQKEILKSKLLNEQSYTYYVPTADDDLVKVDADGHTITAKTYTRGGHTWIPVNASVTAKGNTEKVTLKEKDGQYTGTFRTEGNTYSVSVTYTLSITMDIVEQEQLLSYGPNMKHALDQINIITKQRTNLELFTQYLDRLMKMVNGISLSWGGTIRYADESGAVREFHRQKNANGGDIDLVKMIKQYHAAPSKSQYLLTNGTEFYNKAFETATYLQGICKDRDLIESLVGFAGGVVEGFDIDPKLIKAAFDSLEEASTAIEGAVDPKWEIIDQTPVRSGLGDADYQKLDALLVNMDSKKPAVEIKDTLEVDSTVISVNMNRYSITVHYQAEVIDLNHMDTDQTVALTNRLTGELSLDAGSTYQQVLSAISTLAVEKQVLAGWSDYQVGREFYNRIVVGMGQKDTLQSNVTLTVTYTPKTMYVAGLPELADGVPYGYNATLPSHPEEDKVYDYSIDGKFYRQGQVFRVTHDAQITHTEGTPWIDTTWGSEIAASVSDKAVAILKNPALNTGALVLRKPGSDAVKITAEGNRYHVTAQACESGISGLNWVAVQAFVIDGSKKVLVENFTNGTGSFEYGKFDKVQVQYELQLNGALDTEALLELYNLPYRLTEQAAAQKQTMDQLLDKKEFLAKFGTYASLLKTILRDERVNEAAATALTTIIENCINQTAQEQRLFLYEYLLQYDEDGLAWYYTGENYEKLDGQLRLLREQLGIFIDETPKLLEIMKDYMDGLQPGLAEDYYGKIDSIRTTLDSINLLKPHERIVRSAGELDIVALTEALEDAIGQMKLFETAPDTVMTEMREAPAPDKCSVTLRLEMDGRPAVTVSVQFELNHILTQEDIDNLREQLEQMIHQQAVTEDYYVHHSAVLPAVGTELTTGITLTDKWTVRKIPAYVEGEEASLGSFTLTQPYLVLSPCTQVGFRYRYYINGRTFETYDTSRSVTLTVQDMEFIRLGGKIIREIINIARQDVLDLISVLNNDLTKAGSISSVAFIPVENEDGKISIVLRISPRTSGYNGRNAFATISQTLMMYNKYPYVDLGGHPLREDTQIHLQGLLNALSECGFEMKTLSSSINADGTVTNMELKDHWIMEDQLVMDNGNTVPNGNLLGAQIIQTTLSLAANNTIQPTEVAMYITISDDGSNAEQMQEMKLGIEQLTQFVNLRFAEGYGLLELSLTEQSYQKFLAAMIVTDHASLGSINGFDYGVCVEYLYDLIAPLLDDESITADTLENTAAAGGQTVELSAAKNALKRLQNLLRLLNENGEFGEGETLGDLYRTEVALDADALLDQLTIPEAMRNMVAENGEKLNVNVAVRLTNINSKYEALIIDKTKPQNQAVTFVNSVTEAFAQLSEGAVVILLENVTANLTADQKIILDLNGKKMTGNLSGKLILVDSTLENSGYISGSIGADVQDLRISGLYQVQEEEGTYRILLSMDIFTGKVPVEQAASALMTDIFFRFYTSAALELNGEVIYQMDADEILNILENGGQKEGSIFPNTVEYEGFNKFFNRLLEDLTNAQKLLKAIQDQKPLASYDIRVSPWTLFLIHEEDTDTITSNYVPATETKNFRLELIPQGGEDWEDLIQALAQAIEKDITISLEQIQGGFDGVTVSGSGTISLKFRGGKDTGYAPALLAVLSTQVEDKVQIIAALEAWFKEENVEAMKLVLENIPTELLFRAVRSIDAWTDMFEMAKSVGLSEDSTTKLALLLENNKILLVHLAQQLNNLQVEGTQQKLGTLEVGNTFGVYDLSAFFPQDTVMPLLFGQLPMQMQVTMELFNNDPSFEGGTVSVVTDGSVILGSKVDAENKIIYLDTANAGITLEQFNMLVLHSATNATQVKADFAESSSEQKGVVLRDGKYYVVNGAKVTFCASNDKSNTVAHEQYTVILMGDVNSDGIINVSDAVALANHTVGNLNLSQAVGEEALLAANMDGVEVINISDVVRIAYKCVNKYTSILK